MRKYGMFCLVLVALTAVAVGQISPGPTEVEKIISEVLADNPPQALVEVQYFDETGDPTFSESNRYWRHIDPVFIALVERALQSRNMMEVENLLDKLANGWTVIEGGRLKLNGEFWIAHKVTEHEINFVPWEENNPVLGPPAEAEEWIEPIDSDG